MAYTDWQQQGQEPDYRFSLANERTFLAWMRTALALLASGVALDQFVPHVAAGHPLIYVALGLVAISALLGGMAYFGWRANQIAMRHMKPLPTNRAVGVLAWALPLAGSVIGSILLALR